MPIDITYSGPGLKGFELVDIKSVNDSDGAEIVGYFTTPDVDRTNEITLPSAFENTMPQFMKNPVLTFNHNFDNLIGTIEEYDINEKGVKVRAKLHDLTQTARDVAAMVRAGILKTMSFMFDVIDVERGQDGEPTILKEVELYEVSLVTVPMNPNAIITEAKAKGLEISQETIHALSPKGGGKPKKGVSRMDPEVLKKEIDSSLEPVRGEVKNVKASVSDLKSEIGNVAKLQNEMKEVHGRDKSEVLEFTEKLSKDFKAAVDKLFEAQKASASNIVYGGRSDIAIGAKKALSLPEASLKRILTPGAFGDVDQFRRLNDGLKLADQLQAAMDADYARMPLEKRIQRFMEYEELKALFKAIDTSTSSQGTEWLPTDYSRRLLDMVRIDQVVAPLHPKFTMREASQVMPVEGADTEATRATQRTTVVSTKAETTEQTPGTANKTYTAEKLRGRIQWSGEADADLVISMIDFLQMKLARSIARAIDNAVISGDDAGGTGYDTGDLPGSGDARYCWNGYRQLCQSAKKIDMSTFSESKINSLRALMGKYAQRPNDFFYLMSITGYLLHCLDPDEMPSFRTVDKYGPQATVLTGELGKINGTPLFISEYVLDTYNASGVYDGTTTTKTLLIAVNRAAMMLGEYQSPTMEIVRDALYDVYDMLSYWRGDFQCIFDATAEAVVAIGYNISTS